MQEVRCSARREAECLFSVVRPPESASSSRWADRRDFPTPACETGPLSNRGLASLNFSSTPPGTYNTKLNLEPASVYLHPRGSSSDLSPHFRRPTPPAGLAPLYLPAGTTTIAEKEHRLVKKGRVTPSPPFFLAIANRDVGVDEFLDVDGGLENHDCRLIYCLVK